MQPAQRQSVDENKRRMSPLAALGIVGLALAVAWLLPWCTGTRAGTPSERMVIRDARGAGHTPRPGSHTTLVSQKPKRKPGKTPPLSPMVVLGYNDLGMHCMNSDFSELCLLPPFNNLHAQVIDRSGEEPRIVRNGVTVSYSIPGNTTSANKTNFWIYAKALFGVKLAPNVGLTGNGLSGTMKPDPEGDWSATGIPLTPIMDDGTENPYALSAIKVARQGKLQASTSAVVPVSWEISCNLCHNTPGISVETDILRKHDTLHGTTLEAHKPVLCASCHADPALNSAGKPGVKTLSSAMHGAHANRFTPPVIQELGGTKNTCYACHPGMRTHCQRDIHYAKGITCTNCHGTMADVGNPARTPWVDEPRCASCHQRAGFAFEEPGKLYKQSRGHNGVMCAACHGSPHAITPTVTAADNVQAILVQGHAGTINDCRVCHKTPPEDGFNHSLDD